MKVNSVYRDFFEQRGVQVSILYGGAGSGKSYCVFQKIIVMCLESSIRVLVMRATQASLKDSCIALVLSILNQEGIDYKWYPSTLTLYLGESAILFKGGDNPERLKSITDIDIAVFEECTELNPDVVDQCFLRLRRQGTTPQFIFMFNPVSKNSWVYRYYFDTESPEYYLDGYSTYILKTTWRDNVNNLPPQYIKTLQNLAKSNPRLWTIYDQGDWGTTGRLVFEPGTYKIEALQIPLGCKHVWGADPGVTDKFAICGSAYISATNTLYTYKELCQSEILCKEVAEWAKSNVPGGVTIWTDNAGKAQIQELNSLGAYNFVSNSKPPGSVQSDIDRLHSFNWVINPSCVNLIKDLQMYQYEKDKKTGLYLNEPAREVDGYHCDAIDAVRYSLEGLGASLGVYDIKNFKGL